MSFQKCPVCEGFGLKSYTNPDFETECRACKGAGIINCKTGLPPIKYEKSESFSTNVIEDKRDITQDILEEYGFRKAPDMFPGYPTFRLDGEEVKVFLSGGVFLYVISEFLDKETGLIANTRKLESVGHLKNLYSALERKELIYQPILP